MNRCAGVLILPLIRACSGPNNSTSTDCFPSFVLDHFVLPVTVQRKSSAMLATKGSELPFDSSSKIFRITSLFSGAPIFFPPWHKLKLPESKHAILNERVRNWDNH